MTRTEQPTRCCVDCGEPVSDPGTTRCLECYASQRPMTPLREWRLRTGGSLLELSERTGIPYRTIKRIAQGKPASGENAITLAEHTGYPIEQFLRGVEWAA